MALLGDLVVTLEADSQRFEQGLNRSQKQLSRFEKSSVGALLSSNKFRGGLTQASFAVDDFAGVLAAGGGLGAALRSTSNNIGTLVTAINPIAGIATTLAITIGSTLIPKLFDMGDAAEEAAERFEKFDKTIKNIEDRRSAVAQQSLEQLTLFNSDDIDTIDAEIARVEKALRRTGLFESQIAQLNAQLERLEVNRGLAELNRELERLDELNRIGEIDSLDALNDQLEESQRLLERMRRESDAIHQQLLIQEQFDPTGSFPGRFELFREQDKRLEEIDQLQEQIDALQKREAELLGQAAASAALTAVGAGAAGLPATVEREVTVVEDVERTGRPAEDRFAGFAQRGTAEAFSAILKATQPDQQSKSLASIEASNKTIAKSGQETAKSVAKIAEGAGRAVALEVVESFT